MSRLTKIVPKDCGDQIAALADALLLSFLPPIPKDCRRLARLVHELREQVQAAGGVTERDIERLIREYRERKRAGQ
jgi:hypothetical protein